MQIVGAHEFDVWHFQVPDQILAARAMESAEKVKRNR